MTNTHSDPSSPGKQEPIGASTPTPIRYKLTWKQALQDFRDGLLTPRGLIYYSVATRGKRLKVKVDEYCKELGIGRATYYRAIGALSGNGRLNIDAPDGIVMSMPDAENQAQEAESFTASELSQLRDSHLNCETVISIVRQSSQMCDSESQLRDSESQLRDSDFSEPPLGASFKNGECTNRSIKNLKDPIGTSTVDPSGLNSGELGTKESPSNPYAAEIRHFLLLATQAGIRTNGAIAKTLMTLRSQRSAAETLKAVENSISAIVEMMEQGRARDPGALLNASLQREINGQGFTANGAKKAARERYEASSGKPSQPPPEHLPGEPPSAMPIADLSSTIAAIDCELMRLEWSKDQAIAHMVEHWGWRPIAFSRLSDADLYNLLAALREVEP